MKNIIYTMLLCLSSMMGFAQSGCNNYIKTTTILDSRGNNSISYQFFDGLGRPNFTATNGISGRGEYSYSLKEYDQLGQDSCQWYSVPAYNLDSLTYQNFKEQSSSFYNDPYAFHSINHDVLGRETAFCKGGQRWVTSNKKETLTYSSNADTEVKKYKIINNNLVQNGYFATNALTIECCTDEDNHIHKTYKNLFNEVVMTDDAGAKTYYIYNNKGLLIYVLTPQYQESEDIVADAYKYEYDSFNRISSKSLPGCAPTTYTYNDNDQISSEQTPILREQELVRFFCYDKLGRMCIQGICSESSYIGNQDVTVSTVTQNESDYEICSTGYVSSSMHYIENDPNLQFEIINYYDDYMFLAGIPSLEIKEELSNPLLCDSTFSKGMLTGQMVATTDSNNLYSSFYYNYRGKIVDERHSTLKGDVYKMITTYSFTDKPLTVTKIIPAYDTDENYEIVHSYGYNFYNDQLEKDTIILISNRYRLEKVLSEMTYTDLGQLRREYHPEIEDAIDYSYDIHGWTKSISSQYFSEELFYADGPNTDSFCYNGNISALAWIGSDEITRGYKFKYNDMDMLYQSSYGEGENLTLHTGRYNENITEFNSNGAIVRLTRKGKTNSDSYGIIDYLIYDYDGNKVTGIRDRYPTLLSYNGAFEYRNTHTATAAEPDFEYNSAGMLIKDRDKGISNITYNNIGLVEDIQFDNGARIAYVYSLTGEKLKVTHYSPLAFINPIRLSASQAEEGTTSSTDDRIVSPVIQYPSVIKSSEIAYLGGDVQIECMNGDYTHLFGGGYLKFNPDLMSVPKFYYYAKDHLGNIRSVATKTNGVVEEVQHTAYYPFGGIISDLSTGRDVQNRMYNGKELDTSNNLWWYDYGARQYDPTAPRFTAPDPLAEKYYGWNMYGYCMNNPIKFVDPDGRKLVIWYGEKGHEKSFVFTGFHGKHNITIPNNAFVKAVINSYLYNCKNGGGDQLKRAVSRKEKIYIDDARVYNEGTNEFQVEGHQPTVHWNPDMGLLTTNGGRQSAATILEHEIDHANDNVDNPKNHNDRSNKEDSKYGTKEEQRVITGSEAKTAKCNGEDTRDNHMGWSYPTINPTSTQPL